MSDELFKIPNILYRGIMKLEIFLLLLPFYVLNKDGPRPKERGMYHINLAQTLHLGSNPSHLGP